MSTVDSHITSSCIRILIKLQYAKFQDLTKQLPQIKNSLNLLTPAGHVLHQQFNIQQLYVLPTLYSYVLYLSENKERLVPLTA